MWFDIGILVMFLGQILSLITLTVSLFYSLHSLFHFTFPSDHSSSSSPSPDSLSLPSGPLITPVIPGVNFPLKYLFDFWVCTFLVIVVHEFGHAAAASMERLQIQGCGFFFLFLFPGAYVRIEESIHYLPMYPQLRVYSAGVWHNIVMATICIITLLGLPHLLSIGYFSMEHSIPVVSDSLLHWNPPPSSEAQGVVITHMIPESPLTQSIKVGDILVSINDRSIQSTREFQR
jgi:S2P endopeptidase